MSESLSGTASAMAGGACVNSLSLPIKLALFPEAVPVVAGLMGVQPAPLPKAKEAGNSSGSCREEQSVEGGASDGVFRGGLSPLSPIELMQRSMKNNTDQARRYGFKS